LDIKGLLGPEKLYKKKKGVNPHKEQPERAKYQRYSQATFQPLPTLLNQSQLVMEKLQVNKYGKMP
jgi:hypothetical protein